MLVNNEAGEKIFEKVKERLIWKQTKLEDSMQPPLKAPFPKPDNREQFWSTLKINRLSMLPRNTVASD